MLTAELSTTINQPSPKIDDTFSDTTPSAVNVTTERLPTPHELKLEFPLTLRGVKAIQEGRDMIRRILRREDRRLLVIVGPCSLHDPDSAIEYARRLVELQETCSDKVVLVMRAYLEKPRTTIGWRGYLNDPNLDGSCDMIEGLRQSRRLLTALADCGIPLATELLDIAASAYYSDLISFAAIGARTAESQPHRALVSGLDIPAGFKNGTDGCLATAINGILAAAQGHAYFGLGEDGQACIMRTHGNSDTLMILRGGRGGPNYDALEVAKAEEEMKLCGLLPTLMVDCSHANSGSNPDRQMDVCDNVISQRRGANQSLVSVMIEGHLHAGKQTLNADTIRSGLRYGVSVTDACVDWDSTQTMISRLAAG
jgi:3-deoxy-7-phosphoheptulonate synthase